MSVTETFPTNTEIEEQVRRMTASTRFQMASNQSDFLELVVKRALAGKKTLEVTIGRLLFPGFLKDESTDVRVTASNLRKTLARYYDEEGFGDLVLISFPKSRRKGSKLPAGFAYTPEFSYNPNHRVSKEFRLGEYFLVRGMVEDYTHATKHFANVLKVAPYHIGACLGMAESLCMAAYWDERIGPPNQAALEEGVFQAAKFMDRIHERAKGTWRLWATGGILLGVLGRWDEAKDQFELALSIDRSATEQSRPYLLFLSYSGDTSTKLRVAAQCLDQHVDNISAYTGYASALMRSGKDVDLAEAEEALGRALKMDKTSYKVHAALAELRAKQKRIPECEQHLEYLKLVADKLTYRLVQGILKRRLRVD